MKPGIEIQDIVTGTGEEAVRGKTAIVNVRAFLLNGNELPKTLMPTRQRIDLGRRDCIAGLRYGIEGMRVGGHRELIISSYLAYGEQGITEYIPPNATLRCEVELLEVREPGVLKPEDYPPGRQLIVGWLGDLSHGVAKWQFGLYDDGRYGATVQVPIPGLKWRHARTKIVWAKMEPACAIILIEIANGLPGKFPKDCLTDDRICVDHSEHDGGVHRNRETDELCLAVTIYERGQHSGYYIVETSPAWKTTGLHNLIRELIAPVLEAAQRKP